MAINSFKDKINKMASGEILGETEKEKEEKVVKEKEQKVVKQPSAPKPPKPKKVKKVREPKEKKVREPREKKVRKPKESFFSKPEKAETTNVVEVTKQAEPAPKESSNKPVREALEGYEDVLSILNIKESMNLDVDFSSKDLDYIEFSQTTPLGFDFEEVTDFISRVKYSLSKYEAFVAQRNKELVIVASEVKKVEKKMVEQNQAKELERMIGGMTEEERLIEENMDLRVELNNMKAQMVNGGNSSELNKLRTEINILRTENEMLVKNQINSYSNQAKDDFKLPEPSRDSQKKPESKKGFNPLPAFSEPSNLSMPVYEEEDDFSTDNMMKKYNGKNDSLNDMLKDIGGYDDEK